MQYRRNEGFRFQFKKPVKGLFSIIRRNGKQVQSRSGSVTVIDISPNGLLLHSPLELPIETNQKIEINVSFTINSTKLSYNGTIL
ncbi:PilZ domain-containing protein [Priestia filamentosa]|uniref:PilZ domain-containing protein n=1 Tax=Priestia filamentosa TaxID=1402861 RepID=UPI00036B9209|nr:PilZ domain-containing protein [Priestia filamentosa]